MFDIKRNARFPHFFQNIDEWQFYLLIYMCKLLFFEVFKNFLSCQFKRRLLPRAPRIVQNILKRRVSCVRFQKPKCNSRLLEFSLVNFLSCICEFDSLLTATEELLYAHAECSKTKLAEKYRHFFNIEFISPCFLGELKSNR